MSEEPKRLEEKQYSDKKLGITIIVVAILLIILAVCTNFFSDLSTFGTGTSTEVPVVTSGETKEEMGIYEEESEEEIEEEPVEEIPSSGNNELSGD